MKKIIVIVTLSLLAIATTIYFDFTNPPRIDDEESRTYDSGYEEGISIGKEIGYENGYNDGYNTGSDEWYDIGYEEGTCAGATYTCLFYGDVNRAFKSAQNGCAWFVFVDAYDEYISNIYDNDEKRSSLVWALVSADVGEKVTEDEVELLIKTFGAKIFSNNGISLKYAG